MTQAHQEANWSSAALLDCQTQYARLVTNHRTGLGCPSPSLDPCSRAHRNSSSSGWTAEPQAQVLEVTMATSSPPTTTLMHRPALQLACSTQATMVCPQLRNQAIYNSSSKATPTGTRPTITRAIST